MRVAYSKKVSGDTMTDVILETNVRKMSHPTAIDIRRCVNKIFARNAQWLPLLVNIHEAEARAVRATQHDSHWPVKPNEYSLP